MDVTASIGNLKMDDNDFKKTFLRFCRVEKPLYSNHYIIDTY